MEPIIYTIGHSTHEEDYFLGLLVKHGITAICDVRSAPFSRIAPQFNQYLLERLLQQQGIEYRFLGKELGARSDDPKCYEDGKVQYDRLAETDLFRRGLDRLQRGVQENFRIAVLCAEKEPLDCHRSILIARHLVQRNIQVVHILADGSLENHLDSIRRLVGTSEWLQTDLFTSQDEIIAKAYRRQEQRIAYDRDADEAQKKANGAA